MAEASDKEKEIHQQILQQDDLAFAMLCDSYYEPVMQKVMAFNKFIASENETLVMDVVTDTFIKYFKEPQRYKPEKQTLEKFLVMDAEGDLKNAWEKLKRKNQTGSVGLFEKNRNRITDGAPDPQQQVIYKEAEQLLEKKLRELFANDMDRQVAQLMLAGVRKSAEYARALGIEGWEGEAQKLEIKKQKDRIDKTIKRKFGQ